MKKRGQLTIFIIIAIIIVVLIILFFMFKGEIIPERPGGNEVSPNSFLQNCLKDKVKDGINLISSQGGYISNNLSIGFDDKKVSYLCYTYLNYQPCINQEPVLIGHIENEIRKYISSDVRSCWDSLAENLQEEGYVVDVKKYNYTDVQLNPKGVSIKLENGEIKLRKTEESLKYNNFKFSFQTKLYELAVIAQEISSQEAKFCNFENLGYMLIHPEVKITEKTLARETTVYIIEDRKSKEEFFFAIRSCALPGGLG